MTERVPDSQLVFDLGTAPRYGRDDFLAAPCNRHALERLESWPAWPDVVLILRGPAGAGKSHLAAIWSDLSDAPIVSAAAIDDATPVMLRSSQAIVIEDADREISDPRALFHVVDAARHARCFVLLTARTDPTSWAIGIPDLVSRLRLAPITAIDDPDEALLRAVLVKLLADRQLVVEPSLLDYAARHLGRSLADARTFVDLADRRSLAAARRITRAIAAEVLRDLAAARDEGD